MSTYEKAAENNETESSKDVEMISSEVKDSNNEVTVDKRRNKVKKVKDKMIAGQKRKCSDKIEFNKKIKRKKKELASVDLNKHLSNAVEITAENLMSPSTTPTRSKTGKKNKQNNSDIIDIIDSDVENKEIISQEKSKAVTNKKIKAITNACRDALQVLIKLGIDVLTLMDMSLKILKSHDLLDNKLISNETLLKLIELALISIKSNEEVDANNGTSLSKIITNFYISPLPKPSKAKKNITNNNNKSIQAEVEALEEPLPNPDPKSDEEMIIEPEVILQEETEKEVNLPEEEIEEKLNSLVKSGKNFCITNYFKKVGKTEDGQKAENSHTPRADMHSSQKAGRELSNVRRQILEEEMENQTSEINYLIENTPKRSSRFSAKNKQILSSSKIEQSADTETENKCSTEIETPETSGGGAGCAVEKITLTTIEVTDANCGVLISKNKAKLFQFHDNRRPPYWGTWRRKSSVVNGRKPFGKDKFFNYEIDSDDEWEEEPGESLHGSDDEKEPEEDYEVDNDFFVPHGYLSDDENPEKENMSPKTKLSLLEEQFSSELKQKTKKMTPIVFGTYWENKNSPSKEGRFQDLGLGKLQYSYWVTPPILIEEEETEKNNDSTLEQEQASQTKKTRNKTTFPDTEIPNLIRMVHGSPHNSDWLAKKFLEQRDSEKIDNGKLTKICVLKKIKELASWQANSEKKMCWHVPKDVQLEFKTEVALEKKAPQKCYIWKFVKKGNKTTGMPSPVPEGPEVIDLD